MGMGGGRQKSTKDVTEHGGGEPRAQLGASSQCRPLLRRRMDVGRHHERTTGRERSRCPTTASAICERQTKKKLVDPPGECGRIQAKATRPLFNFAFPAVYVAALWLVSFLVHLLTGHRAILGVLTAVVEHLLSRRDFLLAAVTENIAAASPFQSSVLQSRTLHRQDVAPMVIVRIDWECL